MALNLQATIGLDGSGFEAGIHKVTESLKEVALSAFGIYSIEQALSKTIEKADRLADTAQRLGIGLTALQEFQFAAEQTGASVEELTAFVEKFNAARIDPKKIPLFAKFGIDNISSIRADDALMKIHDAFQGHNPADLGGFLREIGGKGAGSLTNLFLEDLEALRKKAHDVAAVMGAEDIVALKMMKDELNMVEDILIAKFAPALVTAIEYILKFAGILDAAGEFWVRLAEKNGGIANAGANWLQATSARQMLESDAKHPWMTDEQRAAAHKSIDTFQPTLEEAVAAKSEIDEKWKKTLDDLRAEIKKRANELNNPPPPRVEIPEATNSRSSGRREAIYSDSLLRVGNFLGHGADASNPTVTILNTHTILLTRIANNTQRRAIGGWEPGLQLGLPIV